MLLILSHSCKLKILLKSLSLHLQLEGLTIENVPLHPLRPIQYFIFYSCITIVLFKELSHLPPHPHLQLLRLNLIFSYALSQPINPLLSFLLAFLQTGDNISFHNVELGPQQPYIIFLAPQFFFLLAELILNEGSLTMRYVQGRWKGSSNVNYVPSSSLRKLLSKLVNLSLIPQLLRVPSSLLVDFSFTFLSEWNIEVNVCIYVLFSGLSNMLAVAVWGFRSIVLVW